MVQVKVNLTIDEVLNGLELKKVYMAGVSYGAYLAVHYLINRTERVYKVVCLSGNTNYNPLRMLKVFLPEAIFPTKNNTKRLLKKLCGDNHTVFTDNDCISNHWFLLLKYFNNKSMFLHKITKYDKSHFDKVNDKIIFLIGEDDILVNYTKAIKKLEYNDLEYRIIPKAGHGINHQQATLINALLRDFLQ